MAGEVAITDVWAWLEHTEIFIGIICAVLSVIFAIYRFRHKIISPIISTTRRFKQYRAQVLFEDLKPLLEVEMDNCLQAQNALLEDHGITLRHSAAENVEFRQYINNSMDTIQKSMDKMTLLIMDTKDKHDINCVETQQCNGDVCYLYRKCTLSIKK